jgi:hypothetical protein
MNRINRALTNICIETFINKIYILVFVCTFVSHGPDKKKIRRRCVKYKTVEDAAEYTILLKRRNCELVYFFKIRPESGLPTAAYTTAPLRVGKCLSYVLLPQQHDGLGPATYCGGGHLLCLPRRLPANQSGQAAQRYLVAEHTGNIRHLGNALERQDRLRCGANYLPRSVDGLARRDSIDHRKTKDDNPQYAKRLVGRL